VHIPPPTKDAPGKLTADDPESIGVGTRGRAPSPYPSPGTAIGPRRGLPRR